MSNVTGGEAVIKWSAPFDNGGGIVHAYVISKTSDASNAFTVDGNEFSLGGAWRARRFTFEIADARASQFFRWTARHCIVFMSLPTTLWGWAHLGLCVSRRATFRPHLRL